MLRIYDCSNSAESDHGKEHGPIDNDIIRGLKEHARLFDCKFINKYTMADVIITNDIFPEEIKKSDIPKIKRMDGIYWDNENKHKNISLNESAEIADHVIFISEYSKKSLNTLYPEVKIKESSVILNTADNRIFRNGKQEWKIKRGLPAPYINDTYEGVRTLSASCTDWSRKVKRFDSLMQLARLIPEKLYLIGRCDMETPGNVIKLGYISDNNKINDILNDSDVFVNLSYRDAGAKVVCQAVACGIPVLYADSGGVSELIDYGMAIPDEKEIYFADDVYELDPIDILKSYNELKNEYRHRINTTRNYMAMISNYYKIITDYGNRKKILDKE